MSVWTILTKVRDPLGELPTREEWRLRRQYEVVRHKVRALEVTAHYTEDVQMTLHQAQQELDGIMRRLPRGHTPGFMVLCLWVIFMLTPLVLSYPQFDYVWQSPNFSCLREYRPFSFHVVQAWQILMSSSWSALLPILILAWVWSVQHRLVRWRSRTFIKTVAGLITLLVFISCVSWMYVFMIPFR